MRVPFLKAARKSNMSGLFQFLMQLCWSNFSWNFKGARKNMLSRRRSAPNRRLDLTRSPHHFTCTGMSLRSMSRWTFFNFIKCIKLLDHALESFVKWVLGASLSSLSVSLIFSAKSCPSSSCQFLVLLWLWLPWRPCCFGFIERVCLP